MHIYLTIDNITYFSKVRIDHTSRTLSFGSDLNYATREDAPIGPHLQSMPSEQIRNQLTAMSSVLAKALEVIKPAHILVCILGEMNHRIFEGCFLSFTKRFEMMSERRDLLYISYSIVFGSFGILSVSSSGIQITELPSME